MTNHTPILISDVEFSYNHLKEKYHKVFFLCDNNTYKYCFFPYFSKFISPEHVYTIHEGEKSKSIENAALFCSFLFDNHADKNSLIINLGGGMVSDLGGFCASIYQRGIDYVNMPTSLLAAADASIGGKTAVNLNHTKNILGLFSQPHSILFFPDFLQTLPEDEWLSGWAEIIKSVLLFDDEKWEELNQLNQLPLTTNKLTLSLIEFCWKHKCKIVYEDFYDKGIRQSLNYGHTIGHVIETLSIRVKNPLLHGFAIAAGMKFENLIAVKLGLMNEDEAININYTLEKWFPVINHIKLKFTKEFENILLNDKKNKIGKINMSLLSEPGKFKIQQDVPMTLIEETINKSSAFGFKH